ncbi:MAG: hypothetical protein N2691_03200 [Patescibacteria group bacterium]|nr:hypothetical protein [Patescibacteria group bacterium]
MKFSIWILFFSLMMGNVYVFVKGVELSDRIHTFESEINMLKQQNSELETKIYKAESITYAASLAAELDYGKKSEPVFFGEKKYALK